MRAERYILQVRPQREREAKERLALRGITVAVPHTRTFERVSRKRIIRCDEPVFRGYAFIKATPEQLPRLREVDCVCPHPLMVDGQVRPMTASERAYIAQTLRRPPADPRDPYPNGKPDPKAPPFKVGQPVKVMKQGAFLGYAATVSEMWRKGKKWMAEVDVMIFGRPTPLKLNASALVAA